MSAFPPSWQILEVIITQFGSLNSKGVSLSGKKSGNFLWISAGTGRYTSLGSLFLHPAFH
jgi:hypothetical protein